MANEITITTGLQIQNANLIVPTPASTKRFNQTTARGGGPGTVDIGTTEETIDFGDIVPGWVEFRNLDATNFVDLGFATGAYGIRLPANGGSALFFVRPGTTIYAVADTAACSIQVSAANT